MDMNWIDEIRDPEQSPAARTKQKKRACATCISHRHWFTERCTTLRADVRRTAERNNKAKQPVTLNGFHMFML